MIDDCHCSLVKIQTFSVVSPYVFYFFLLDFRQFDYGFFGNLGRYQSPEPPKYDLSKVTAPLYIHYAPNDWIVVPEVQSLIYTCICK